MQGKISFIEGNTELKDLLAALASLIISEKKLVFPIADYSFNKYLIDSFILKIECENYEVLDHGSVAYSVFRLYEELFTESIKADFTENVKFLKAIDEDFKFDRFVSGLIAIKKFFWQYAILQSNKKFGCQFVEYLSGINRDSNREEIYNFSDAYSVELYELDIDFESVYGNAVRLLLLLKDENDSNDGRVINLNFSAVFNGLKKSSEEKYSLGLKLLEFAFVQEPIDENIISSIISGLYNAKK